MFANCRTYTTITELKADFVSGALHPGDLKPALARHLNEILEPVRQHFENDPHAKELLKKVKVSSYPYVICSMPDPFVKVLQALHCFTSRKYIYMRLDIGH